jgi:SAM-dependent methyltransferase
VDPVKKYVKDNRAAWEEAFAVSKGYGKDVVACLEEEPFPFFVPEFAEALEKCDLKGKSIAQFCCNNGRELLSLVKHSRAANGIGFDVAEGLVRQAEGFALTTGIPCAFVRADVLSLGNVWTDRFDMAFFTVGALCWFDDLATLFAVVRRTLRKGSPLLIHDFHPFTDMLAVPTEPEFDPANPAKVVLPYFRGVPFTDVMGMKYMAGNNYPSKPFTSFAHTLSDLFEALAANGFDLVSFQEYDRDISGNFPHLEGRSMPLSYVLKAKTRA